ncbi:bi-domain-containing oxidoreductase [Dyadobacter sp. CY323]|uniref:bi-domain-containing oxidoreductase n=1 Tax=Dyadobacter sp. CY323 TaxID=2907302 RepID=UPI001F2B4856|nr:bi-domain-containing oxidoreductase [Dyadobacter sp. CY323]MCE6988977.1 bi-domain-containing oxidoreductase [Dyadobacter sp. CY323]
MKQLAQNLRIGKTVLLEVPSPIVQKGCILIRTHNTLVSTGTERMLVEFSKAAFISKVRQHPEKVRLVFDKIKTDGLFPTLRALSNKLAQCVPMGYCNAGEVIAIGEGVQSFRIGDRVVSNGPHAGVVCVPVNLAAKIPSNVTYEDASFTVVAAIGLQGIRLLGPQMGDTVVVIGLGLIGLLTAELLTINGCRVIGIEPDPHKRYIAAEKGITVFDPSHENLETTINESTNGIGADGVLITAASESNGIISLAARISRKRGKVVLVGSVGLKINRADFYEKELTFQVSCSYGPGRYDQNYEENGVDYPVGLVRWTENRNFCAILEMLSSGALNVKSLISRRVALPDFESIYQNLNHHIAILIDYPGTVCNQKSCRPSGSLFPPTEVVTGIIGAGNYVRSTLLPLIKNASIKYIASAGGLHATELSARYKIPIATADYHEILRDREVDLVIIATRHDLHSQMVVDALKANTHVFVEKPLALFPEDLEEIIKTYEKSGKSLSVGFNRRFSPHSRKIKNLLGGSVMHVVITVNAGHIPAQSWIHDRLVGGGRILGEGCHFIDLISYLTGNRVVEVCMNAAQEPGDAGLQNANIMLRYANGSTGIVNYFSNGHRSYSKERVEVYSGGRTLILDDFCRLTGYGFKGFSSLKTAKDKGHKEQFCRLWETLKTGGNPHIDFHEIVNTTRATFAALESYEKRCWIQVP